LLMSLPVAVKPGSSSFTMARDTKPRLPIVDLP
jgi:hypothetical protein